jgi:uncharacterized protein (TIGR03067 family)
MKRILRVWIWLWIWTSLAVTAAVTAFAAEPSDDAKAVEGSWAPTKAQLGGQPMSDAVLKSISLKLANGKYEVSVAGEPDKGTYTLNPKTKPKSMLITGTEGPNRGKNIPAIYELKGDRLRVCYDLFGAKPPPDFKSPEGTQLYLVTYTRVAESRK